MRKPRLLTLVAGLVVALGATALPASAHSGGKAQLFVRRLSAQPSATAGSYDITVEMIDRDSGEPMSGYSVSVEGSNGDGASIPPTATVPATGGKYTATVPATAGDWTLTIRGAGAPGVGEAVPLDVTRRISFTDSAASVGSEAAGAADDDGGGGGGGAAGAIIAVVAALALLGVGGAFFMKRKAGVAGAGA